MLFQPQLALCERQKRRRLPELALCQRQMEVRQPELTLFERRQALRWPELERFQPEQKVLPQQPARQRVRCGQCVAPSVPVLSPLPLGDRRGRQCNTEIIEGTERQTARESRPSRGGAEVERSNTEKMR